MAKLNPVELAAEIVAAFVSNNPLPKSELSALIHAVHSTVERLAAGVETEPPQVEVKTPAVPIRRSITPDFPGESHLEFGGDIGWVLRFG